MLWIACTAVVMIAGFYTLRPLFRESEGEMDIELLAETELDRLLSRKNVIYRNLRDLEFERKMGRLAESDFQQLAAGYKNEAASLLERIDQLNASENMDQVIEKDIAVRRAKLSGAAAKRARGRCPSCGAELISRKKFCPDCGHRL
jgi:lysine/ornithine N-monooxygenase